MNSNTRALRHECRRAERTWLKDKLQVSYEILRDCLIKYQRVNLHLHLRWTREQLLKFFTSKIAGIRSQIVSLSNHPVTFSAPLNPLSQNSNPQSHIRSLLVLRAMLFHPLCLRRWWIQLVIDCQQ